MNIIVTGATGYLGSRLCSHLTKQGHRVTATGRNIAHAPTDCNFITSDLENLSDTFKNEPHHDALVHCAALSSSWGKRQAFLHNNVQGTEHVINLCHTLKIPKFIHISSPSILARLEDQIHLDESTPVPQRFLNYYAESKFLAEQKVAQAHELSRVILRPQAIIGAGDTTLIPRLIQSNQLSGIPIFKNRRPSIDVTHVDNVIDAIAAALNLANSPTVDLYHISNGEPKELLVLLDELFSRINITLKTKPIPYSLARIVAGLSTKIALSTGATEPRLTPYTLSILAHSRTLNITKAKTKLHYTHRISMEETLDDCAEGWLRNQSTR